MSLARKSYDAFEHLQRSLFLSSDSLMGMFTVHADASGGDPRQKVFTVAGFIATVEQWRMFQQNWPDVLARGGLSVYHAADVEDGERLYGWTKDKKREIQTYAYKTVGLRVRVGISSTVIKEEFERQKIRWHRIPHGKQANYFVFCVHDFMKQVTDWALAQNHHEPLNYVFECGDLGKGEVEAIFDELSSDPTFEQERRELIGAITFAKKKCLYPLQAADIWAYESYKQMINQHMPLEASQRRLRVRVGYRALFRSWWGKYNTYWDRETLAEFAVNARTIGALDSPTVRRKKRPLGSLR